MLEIHSFFLNLKGLAVELPVLSRKYGLPGIQWDLAVFFPPYADMLVV